MTNDVFYVGIKDALTVRKDLLICSKDIIKNLQKYERFKQTREEKIKLIMELSHIMRDLEKLNLRLKADLPKIELRAKKATSLQNAPAKTRKGKKRALVTKKESEIEKLEKELNFIESKLNSLP